MVKFTKNVLMNLNRFLIAGILLFFSLTTEVAFAQAPGASCATAVALGGTGAIPYCTGNVTVSNTTSDGAIPTCIVGGNVFRRDGWYSFVVPVGPNLNITIAASATSSGSNLVIQCIASPCGAQLGCSNATTTDGIQTETLLMTNLSPGTYLIKLTNYANSAGGNMALSNLCVNVTPSNNACATPTALTPFAASANCAALVTYTTQGATPQAAIPDLCTIANANNDDVWFTFNAIFTSQLITVTPIGGMDVVFEVYDTDPCGGAGNSIYCASGFGSGAAAIGLVPGLTNGGTYWVRVYDALDYIYPFTDFTICIQTPPANDECAGAILLTSNTTCITTTGNVNVSSDSFEPLGGTCAGGTPDDDIWYTFVGTGPSNTITIDGLGTFDPAYEVFTGSCGGTSVFCNSVGGNPGGVLTDIVPTTAGVTYYVRVFDYNLSYDPANSTFTICIVNPAPINDNCGGTSLTAYATSACGATTAGTVLNATASGFATACGGTPSNDVWYSFVATSTNHLVTVVPCANLDVILQGYVTTCGTGAATTAQCANAGGAGTTEVLTLSSLSIGTTYYIRVYGALTVGTGCGSFTICVTTPTPPTNNGCTGTVITPGTTCVNGTSQLTGDTYGATQTLAGCSGNANDDVWYQFTTLATAQQYTITVTGSASFDPVFQVFSASCAGTSVICINGNPTLGGIETTNLSTLTTSTNYWIRVYDANSGFPATTTFTICLTYSNPPPANDNCPGTSITAYNSTTCGGVTNGTVVGATASGFAATCGGTPSNDVWYSFVATATIHVVTVVPCANFNAIIQGNSGTCGSGAATTAQCANAGVAGVTETLTMTSLTIGSTYYIRVYGALTSGVGCGTFTICVTIPPLNGTPCTALAVVCNASYANNTTTNNGGAGGRPAITCTSNAQIGNGLWYVLAGTGSNTVLTTCGGTTNYDTQLYVFTATGTCPTLTLTCVTGNDDTNGCGLSSTCTFGTSVGVNYYIYVSGYVGQTGAFTLFTSCITPPVNDQCGGALSVNCGAANNTTTLSWTGSTATASSNNDLTNCGSASGATAQYPTALWYYFQGGGEAITISTCGGTTNFNTMLGVWTSSNGTCTGTWSCVAGNDNFCANSSSVSFLANWGTIYYIEVFGYYTEFFSGPATGNFTLNVTAGTGVNGTGCMPLPIELLSFTGENAGNRNLIKWRTASEVNNDYFTIEKANDGVGWMTLDRVNGAGNSTSAIDYHIYDNEPYKDVTFYRLKQTDYNGAYSYSAIIAVHNKLDGVSVANVHPNPTTDDISFDFNSAIKGNLHIQILDYLGRVVSDEIQNVNDGGSVVNSKMGTLAKGVYSLKVMFDQTGYVSVTKVVKN